MRLAAVVHVQLEAGMELLDPLHKPVEVRLVGSLEEGQQPARLRQKAFGHGGRHFLEVRAAGDRFAACEPEPRAFANLEPVHLDVT